MILSPAKIKVAPRQSGVFTYGITLMSGNETQTDDLTLEHRILIQVRQVLASVVRDVTPPPGMRNPLSASTIEDIRGCFSLIAARERELNSGKPSRDLPVYADSVATTRIVDFKPQKDSGED